MRPLPQNLSADRILVRGVNWLGDAVMTTPALLRLRERFPKAKITLLTHAKLAGLWSAHPAIDEVLTFADGDGVWTVGRRLRAGQFDLALVLPNSPRSALESWRAGIPIRVGAARPWRNWLLTHPVPPRPGHVEMRKRGVKEIQRLQQANRPAEPPPPTAHHLNQYLHLVAALGGNPAPLAPLLAVPETALQAVRQRLGPTNRPLVGINPGAEYGPAKRWPLDNFIQTARFLATRLGAHIILFGGKNDQAMAAQIQQSLDVKAVSNWAGATSLAELCAALKLCNLLITNDTGPMHVAAAVGTPVVAIFGSTAPGLTGPGLPGTSEHHCLRSNAACSPCFLRECPVDFRCMSGVSVEQVLGSVQTALASSNRRQR
jgi:heptosyltransferase-2